MKRKAEFRNSIRAITVRATTAALVITILVALTAALPQSAQAQTFTVIHNFSGGGDGGHPVAGLTYKAGKLYGTALYYGSGSGTVYQLKNTGSGWVFNLLYSFAGSNDGAGPGFNGGALVFGPNGTLYGTTNGGGGTNCNGGGAPYPGCGIVYNLQPSPTACRTALCPWTETVLYRFQGGNDGFNPEGSLVFDTAGNIYGTTIYGGIGYGTVYELTQSGGWKESVIYEFGSDGLYPISGLILDSSGNLYGTTYAGGSAHYGTAYQLVCSNGSCAENLHYTFQGTSDGVWPLAALISDQSGNYYGATSAGGTGGGGTVFELSLSGGVWMLHTLYSFTASGSCKAPNGNDPGLWGTLVMDGAGNLYGTTACNGAHGYGNAFELSPSGGNWTYTDLYDFTGGSDGGNPVGGVVFDVNGNLYGTASNGGSDGHGVVWEITP